MLGSVGQYGGAYLPYWRRQLTIVLDGLRARPDITPLPGTGQEFDEFHDMSHAKGPIAAGADARAEADRCCAGPIATSASGAGCLGGAHLDEVRPRVVEREGAPVVAGRDAVVRHPLAELAEVVGAGTTISTLPRPSARPRRPAPALFHVFMAMWWW